MERDRKDVLVYFNNDGDANAVRNARTLRTLLAAQTAAVVRNGRRAARRALSGRSAAGCDGR